jgi:hypothetical protein
LIFLAFLLPLAIYLLVLGALQRRRHSVLVSGPWDFVGILFATSGFLLFGGPAALSSLSDRWRMFWLIGRQGPNNNEEGAWLFWVFLAAVYFLAVLGGAAFLLWRQRNSTSIYNATLQSVEEALGQVFVRLGLNPVRSGSMYLFGMAVGSLPGAVRLRSDAIQAPHYGSPPVRHDKAAAETPLQLQNGSDLAGQTAVLEIDAFNLMKHVTLRWEPTDSLLRRAVESELAQRLVETLAPAHELGLWITLLGVSLLCFTLLGGCGLVLVQLFVR